MGPSKQFSCFWFCVPWILTNITEIGQVYEVVADFCFQGRFVLSNLHAASSKCVGADLVMKLLSNYCRNKDIKTSIRVGVVGNVALSLPKLTWRFFETK